MKLTRIRTLIGKELRDLRTTPGALLPALVMLMPSVVLPFLMLDLIPRLTGELLSSDKDIQRIVTITQALQPALARLPPEAAAQAFMLQQLLVLFLIGPIVAAVSIAAYSVVGEKQSRALEPLLTTPLTAGEILVAKGLASFIPALVVEVIGVALMIVVVGVFAKPGVLDALMTARTAVLLGLVGPLVSLTSLQTAIAVSSRASDPRSAQQISAVVALPLAAILIGQVTGAFVIGTGLLLLAAVGLLAAWIAMAAVSVALFQRETILTRWK